MTDFILAFAADEDATSIDVHLLSSGRLGFGMVFGKDQTKQRIFGARSPFDLCARGPVAHYVQDRFGFCQAKIWLSAIVSLLPVHPL